MKRPVLYLFARSPGSGGAKTRLRPLLGDARAAEFAVWLLRETIALATENWPSRVELHICYGRAPCDNALIQDALIQAWADQHHLRISTQIAGDLGVRIRAALETGIAQQGAAAVLGCDVPHCPPSAIEQAHESLAAGRAVLGRAEDGGFWLLGLTRLPGEGVSCVPPGLFDGITWGGPDVAQTLIENAARGGLVFEELPVLRDLDRPEDLFAVADTHEPLRAWLAGGLGLPIIVR